MARAVVMPKLGQSEEVGTIVQWRKKEGDTVAKGDILFEIETDKALLEVESFFEGTLLKILATEGQTAPVQTIVGYIGQPGEPLPETPVPSLSVTAGAPSTEVAIPAPTPPGEPAVIGISPRAARMARESGIDVQRVSGTGPNGRVLEKDVKAYIEAQASIRLQVTSDAEQPKPMSRMRRTIADRLTRSFTTTPHFFMTVSVDMSDLVEYRGLLKSQGSSYTITDFLVKAAASALKEFPVVNSTTDGESTRWHSHVNVGLAVALDEGLVVAVIRDADKVTMAEIHERASALVAKAHSGKLTPDEMMGSTFTLSNMGMMDVENFTAIINPGESAILALSSIMKTPVVIDEGVVVRSMMKMTLSADHRFIDGATAAKFINAIKRKLEDAAWWVGLVQS